MGMFRLFDRVRPSLCAGLVALPLFATSMTGCISQMQADISANQKRLDSLEDDLEVKRTELEEASFAATARIKDCRSNRFKNVWR